MGFGMSASSSAAASPATKAADATDSKYCIHPASRIDPREHDPQIFEMVSAPISYGILDYFLNTVALIVAYAVTGGDPRKRPESVALQLKSAQMTWVIHNFISQANLHTPVVLVALVYLTRVGDDIELDGSDWVCERLALGALIAAFKQTNDIAVKSQWWATCSGIFSAQDVNRIERDFLHLLNFDMQFDDADLLAHHDDIARATHAAEDPWVARNNRAGRTMFAHPVPSSAAEYRLPVAHPPSPSPSPMMQAIREGDVPSLMYPDPDSPRSYDSPITTPPDDGTFYHYPGFLHGAAKAEASRNPYVVHPGPPPQRDVEMDARARWYAAAEAGSRSGPAESPRYEPFSPQHSHSRPQEPAAAYPWRCYDTGNVWGPSGLFKI
ncbi:hypothetical protein C8Q79DRAFT_928183 [Trametes meyenii]|nr:hypothetical protein C8Q79DRAFT_928183 [Trametes meyenii]